MLTDHVAFVLIERGGRQTSAFEIEVAYLFRELLVCVCDDAGGVLRASA